MDNIFKYDLKHDILFQKCKESVEDVVGWKVFIFLPQNLAWRLFIIHTVFLIFFLSTFQFLFQLELKYYDYVELLCNVFYFADTICATMHYLMKNTRVLRRGAKRHEILLFLDYISLLPIHVIGNVLVFTDNPVAAKVFFYSRLNVTLRIYQIQRFFSDAKYLISTIKMFFFLVCVEVMVWYAILSHIISCLFYLFLTPKEKSFCHSNVGDCILQLEFFSYSLLGHQIKYSNVKIDVLEHWYFTSVMLLVGHYMLFAFFFPKILHAFFKYSSQIVELAERQIQMELIVDHLTENKKLKKKIFKYVQNMWKYGDDKNPPISFETFPLSFKKNLYCDIHWEALRHSKMLCDLNLGCKRSLSLKMEVQFIASNTIILDKEEMKTFLIYIDSGLLQAMAEENSNSPVLTLSSGTILGEFSLFHPIKSKVTLKTAKDSVIHVLKFRDFFLTMLDYPHEMGKLTNKLKYRISIGRATYERKMQISLIFSEESATFALGKKKQANIKWIKQQYRAIVELDEVLKKKKGLEDHQYTIKRKVQKLDTQLEHTSVNLNLLAVNDQVLNKYDVVCLKMKFPWSLDPECSFLIYWNHFVLIVVFFTTWSYPIFTGWYKRLPIWFFNITLLVNFVYFLDLLIVLMTAIQIRNAVVYDFWKIMAYRLMRPQFYCDIVASIPLQLLVYFYVERFKFYHIAIITDLVLLKFYKVISFLNKWNYSLQSQIACRTIIKNIYFASIFTFWLSIAFYLLEVECIYYKCSHEWVDEYKKTISENDESYKMYAAVFAMMYVSFKLPFEFFKTEYFHSLCLYFAIIVCIRLFLFLILAECISASVLQNLHLLNYKNIINFLARFVQLRKITGRVSQRVSETMTFQWKYDRGEYITQRETILNEISPQLLDEIIKDSVYHSLRMCPLFEEETEELVMDLIRSSQHFVLPANSLLITFDTQTMNIFLIHKGFVQLTSFLQNDVVNNVGKELFLGRGALFPVVVVLNQEPSVVTARTLTDCELIIFNLETILKNMIVHDMFKDVVQSLIDTTDFALLASGKRGLSRIQDVFKVNYTSYLEAFSKYKWFGIILRLFLRRRAINSNSVWYIQWEIGRVICIFLGLALWPFVFGCLCLSDGKIILMNLLLLLDSLTWVDFYIRLHVAYYNSYGICVTHPSSTCLHYLTTSFLPDFISFLPHIHVLYFIHKQNYNYNFDTYISHMILRGFAWYRFFGLIKYLTDTKNFIFRLQFVKFIFTAVLLYNAYINGRLLYALKINDRFFLYRYRPLQAYLAYLVDLVINLLTSLKVWAYFEGFLVYGIIHQIFVALIGWLAEIFFFSYVILDAANANKNFMVYRFHLKHFLSYLNKERVKENVIKKCVEHFEHEWNQKQGEDFKKIFLRFPDSLHEDLLYPLYRTTFSSTLCLAQANEGFYRSLSRFVDEVVFKKGSIIIFNKQVQEDIFFIYKGQCSVSTTGLALCKGSMIGNLRKQVLMNTTIVTKTHSVLLRISAEKFFITLNNFHDTKRNYEYFILSNNDDYFKSAFEDITAVVEEVLIPIEEEVLQEAEFEFVDSTQKQGDKKVKTEKELRHKEFKGVMNPKSRLSKTLRCIFITCAISSVSLVLIKMGLRSIAIPTFLLMYFFDAIWILKIIVTCKMAYLDNKTGYLVTNQKAIFMRYLNRCDGFILDVISVIPFEMAPIIYHLIAPNVIPCRVVFALCANRLLRFFYFQKFASKVRKKLSSNLFNRWGVMLLSKLFMINTCVCICLIVNFLYFNYGEDCFRTIETTQLSFYLNTTACVINAFVGAGRPDCFPKYYIRLWEDIFISLWAFHSKAKLLVEILHISHIFFSSTDHIKELQRLQNYLASRDVSPALLNRARNYYTDILQQYKGSATPFFLTTSPNFIRVNIMEGIYSNHLKNCYLFQDLDSVFLQQLAARLEKNIFFPGDYIVEKSDVDQTMYFIHKGEVFCIDKNDEYPALEVPIYLYVKDDNFGLHQGIFKSYPHTNTYRAKTKAEVLLLNFQNWEDMRLAYPEIAAEIFDRAFRKATDKPFKAKTLMRKPSVINRI